MLANREAQCYKESVLLNTRIVHTLKFNATLLFYRISFEIRLQYQIFVSFCFLSRCIGDQLWQMKCFLQDSGISWRTCLFVAFLPFLGWPRTAGFSVISSAIAIVSHKTTNPLCGLVCSGKCLQCWEAGARSTAWLWRRAGTFFCIGPLKRHDLCMCTFLQPVKLTENVHLPRTSSIYKLTSLVQLNRETKGGDNGKFLWRSITEAGIWVF